MATRCLTQGMIQEDTSFGLSPCAQHVWPGGVHYQDESCKMSASIAPMAEWIADSALYIFSLTESISKFGGVYFVPVSIGGEYFGSNFDIRNAGSMRRKAVTCRIARE